MPFLVNSLDRAVGNRSAHIPMVAGSRLTDTMPFLALLAIFFCLTAGSNPKYANFKVQKHHDSQELTIPDLDRFTVISWKTFWHTPILHTATHSKCHFTMVKRKLFGVKLQNVSFFPFR